MFNSLQPMDCSMTRFPVYHQLPELTQTHAHQVGDAIQTSHHLPSPSPAISLSQHQGLFQWVSLLLSWPKYWSFSFSISPSNEYSGLISFGIDWLDLLAVQGTLNSLLQHHKSKASVIPCSAFFMVQLLYPYMTSGKTIALTIWTSLNRLWGWLQTESGGLVLLPTRLTGFPEENDRREGEAATALTAWLPATAGSLLAVVLYSLASSKVL